MASNPINLPLHIEEGRDDDDWTDVKSHTMTICSCRGIDRRERYARAAFIVRACHSHEAFLSLFRAVAQLQNWPELEQWRAVRRAMDKAQAAINEAQQP